MVRVRLVVRPAQVERGEVAAYPGRGGIEQVGGTLEQGDEHRDLFGFRVLPPRGSQRGRYRQETGVRRDHRLRFRQAAQRFQPLVDQGKELAAPS